MEFDTSPNPPPQQQHPLHNLGIQSSFHSPPPRHLLSHEPPFVNEEQDFSSNIPLLVITESENNPVPEDEEILDSKLNTSKSDSDTLLCVQPSQTTTTGTAATSTLLSQTSTKKLKYQTKAMYERSVSWIKKFRSILKDSPLVLLGLASKDSPKPEEVLEQGKILFEDFLYLRLKEKGFGFDDGNNNEQTQNIHHSKIISRDVSASKFDGNLNSVDSSPKPVLSAWQKGCGEAYEQWHSEYVSNLPDVSFEIHNIGLKLETTYPKIYKNVLSQACASPLKNEGHCRRVIVSAGDTLFKNGTVSWARIIALFSLAASVAVECYHNNEHRYVQTVTASVAEIIEKHIVDWVVLQGGWTEVTRAYREINQETRTLWALLGIGASFGFAFTWVTSQQW